MRRALAALLTMLFAGSGAGFYVAGYPVLGALTPLSWLLVQNLPVYAWRTGWLSGAALFGTAWVAVAAWWLMQGGLAAALRPRPERRPRAWVGVGAALIGVVATTFGSGAVWSSSLTVVTVPKLGMMPTLRPGDQVLVRLRHGEPVSPGQVVVFQRPGDAALWMQRVAGVEGQTVAVSRGDLVLDGVSVTSGEAPLPAGLVDDLCAPLAADRAVLETVGRESFTSLRVTRRTMPDFLQVTVPPHSLFVLGDNRDEAIDSRIKGYVGVDEVVGFVDSVIGTSSQCKPM